MTQKTLQDLMIQVQAGELKLEEALAKAAELGATKRAPQPKVDHIAVAQETNAIEDLQKLYKKAAAKMSSAKRRAGDAYETDPAYLRYKEEFEVVKARKNEVYATVADVEDAVEAAIKAGEKLGSILQAFMNQEKKLLEDEVKKIQTRKKLTKSELALELKKSPSKPTQEMLDKMEGYLIGLSQAYLSRNENDQFVIKLNQMSNYIKAHNKSQRKEVK